MSSARFSRHVQFFTFLRIFVAIAMAVLFKGSASGVFKAHPEAQHPTHKESLQTDRVAQLAASGAAIGECLIIEIFAGTGRVTASLK